MTGIVYIKAYDGLPVNAKEILRYAGAKEGTPEIEALIDSCLKEILNKLTYKVCYAELPLSLRENEIDLGFASVVSAKLARNLEGCDTAVLFAATVGLELDRLIARYGVTAPSKALIFQAIGAERIETVCNTFNREITEKYASEGRYTRPRFSPGYGDLPLDFQKDIFRALDCGRKIGLTLNESLLMSPSKSVTAIIGVGKDKAKKCGESGCEECENSDCSFRR
ncbi:MAG: Vitamin B12 dependent methionine synthase activation subunit [Clostridia bacterium]|nr:Vitamin B12 dependent methionine synthase activation subunit [Clostridia bacterium]